MSQTKRSVAILGADALLVALPSTPTQLANACFAGGFADVYPATWGDELIAAGCLEQLEGRTGPAIFCACPLVTEQLRGAAELRRFIVPLISPPVAVAHYIRALHSHEALTITYIGDCPGAADAVIDERLSPHELLATLARRGILPVMQHPDMGAQVARDRRRFYSIPGGIPAPQWLSAQWPKRTLVDVNAGDALASLATQTSSRGNTLIDFAPHLGCACAGAVRGSDAHDARGAVVAIEPPRAQSEIVNGAVRVEVSQASTRERDHEEVTWNDFLAALPAAFAPRDAGAATVGSASRGAIRQGREKKSALPRAYLAARRGVHSERRVATPRPPTSAATATATARRAAAASRGDESAQAVAAIARREEPSSARPSPWVARRASPEGMTGPRALHRPVLAPADRWLLAGLMLGCGFLVAILTSALTVRGIERTGNAGFAARYDTVIAVAAAPPPAPAFVPAVRLVVSAPAAAVARAVDIEPKHADAGAVGTHAIDAPRSSPIGSKVPATRRRVRSETPATAAIKANTRPVEPSSSSAPAPVAANPVVSAPVPSPAVTPPNNAQFLDELRAIHAEIDARKRRMGSLTSSLDSLRHIQPR